MNRLIPLFGLLLWACCPSLAVGQVPSSGATSARVAGASGLRFANPRHSFGPVVGLHHLYHSFHFQNPGFAPIRLEKITISCSCAMAGISIEGQPAAVGDSVPAGASGLIRFRATTEGIDGLKPVQIRVITDQGESILVLILESYPEFSIEPHPIDFGQVVRGDEKRMKVRVTARDGLDFKIADWGRPTLSAPAPKQAEGQSVEAYERALEEHDQKEQLRLREKPSEWQLRSEPVSPGVIDLEIAYRPAESAGAQSVILRVVSSTQRSFKLTLNAHVEGPVFITPAPTVFFGGFPMGTEQEWELMLIDRDPTVVTAITAVRMACSADRFLKISVDPMQKTGSEERTRIVIRATPELPPGELKGVFRIETNHPQFPQFEIQFSAIAHGEKGRD